MVVHLRKYQKTRLAGVSRRCRNGKSTYRLRVGREYKASFSSRRALKVYGQAQAIGTEGQKVCCICCQVQTVHEDFQELAAL